MYHRLNMWSDGVSEQGNGRITRVGVLYTTTEIVKEMI